ncbi:MAG: hypothetical protein HFJ53_01575 [Clostridia bacterium]|jgi:DNA mismatch repair protein MutS2|nr:hypothetical protein [Clostridia bacterium]
MESKYLEKLEYNSILDILESYCITYLGKELCKNLLPLTNKSIVSNLLHETSEGVSLILKKNSPPLINFTNIDMIIKILEASGVLSIKDLICICQILKVSRTLKFYYYTDNDDTPSFYPILDTYFSNLYINPSIENTISNSILDETSLNDNASKELFNIRKRQKNIEILIREKLNFFIHSQTYSKYLQEAIITIRNNRFVIPIKSEYRNMIKGLTHDISSTGSTVFIEPLSIFDLNNELSNLKLEENIEIEKILTHLSSYLYPIIDMIKTNAEIIGYLDFVFAKAKYSIHLDAICPKINDNKSFNLIDACHPLISQEKVVPINISLGNSFSSLVITRSKYRW